MKAWLKGGLIGIGIVLFLLYISLLNIDNFMFKLIPGCGEALCYHFLFLFLGSFFISLGFLNLFSFKGLLKFILIAVSTGILFFVGGFLRLIFYFG